MPEASKSIIRAECSSAGAPQEPEIRPTTTFLLTNNDPDLVSLIQKEFVALFRKDKIAVMEKLPGSEDASNLARPHNIPYAF